MTGVTSSQEALIARILEAGADSSIAVTAFFEGMPNGLSVTKPRRTENVLEFETRGGATIRIRADMLIGISETV